VSFSSFWALGVKVKNIKSKLKILKGTFNQESILTKNELLDLNLSDLVSFEDKTIESELLSI
jgi:hypothetical protein